MPDEADRVQLDAEAKAYSSILERAGPYGDAPSTESAIAKDLKGHSPGMVFQVLQNLVRSGRIVCEGGSYFLNAETRARKRAAREPK